MPAKAKDVTVVLVHEPNDKARAKSQLKQIEATFRLHPEGEAVPFAKNTHYTDLAEHVFPDKDGAYTNPLYLFISNHPTTVGVRNLARKTKEFLEMKQHECQMDILSISAGMEATKLNVVALVRVYGEKPRFGDLYDYLGKSGDNDVENYTGPKIIIPFGSRREYTPDEIRQHDDAVQKQNDILLASSEQRPFLNQLDTYTPLKLYDIDVHAEQIYDLRTKDRQMKLVTPYEDFIRIFNSCMSFVTENERDTYYNVMRGVSPKHELFNVIKDHINRTYIIPEKLPIEDEPALLDKIDRALFDLYVIQDFVEDPNITDITITDPYSICVRYKGNTYLSNVTFIDDADYFRFINGIAIYNRVDQSIPTQTFTDKRNDDYIMRFTLSAPYIDAMGYPALAIRKTPRKKMMSDDLIKAGMMDEKIRDYLIDCGLHKQGKGVVFAGPPGSGKTTLLNWFIEDGYEATANILVIQDTDELFAIRHGVQFQHPVLNPQQGESLCTLEMLGKDALVASKNVFIIGETKGAEICSALRLSNSGCRTALTIHSQSSMETIDKMVELARLGDANTSYDQAKRMVRAFQTIVYLENFQVQEITEIIGYDEAKRDMIYRPIYRRKSN